MEPETFTNPPRRSRHRRRAGSDRKCRQDVHRCCDLPPDRDGSFSIDDPIAPLLLPADRRPPRQSTATILSTITVRHLLQHTSGIFDYAVRRGFTDARPSTQRPDTRAGPVGNNSNSPSRSETRLARPARRSTTATPTTSFSARSSSRSPATPYPTRQCATSSTTKATD